MTMKANNKPPQIVKIKFFRYNKFNELLVFKELFLTAFLMIKIAISIEVQIVKIS